MTPIERAARVLHKLYTEEKERTGATGMPSWDELGEDGVFYFTHRARAVLQAIREPSEGMVEAGAYTGAWDPRVIDDRSVDVVAGNLEIAVWRAMIDRALSE